MTSGRPVSFRRKTQSPGSIPVYRESNPDQSPAHEIGVTVLGEHEPSLTVTLLWAQKAGVFRQQPRVADFGRIEIPEVREPVLNHRKPSG